MVGCARRVTWAIIGPLEEEAMSAVEFGLAPQRPFVSAPRVVPFEQHSAESEAARYAGPFSRTVVSIATDARLKLLADLSESLVSGGLAGDAELESVLTRLNARVRRLMNSDFAILGLSHAEDGEYQFMAFDTADDGALSQESVGALAEAFRTHVLSGKVADLSWNQSDDLEWMATLSMNSCVLPLVSRDRVLGVFALGKRGSIPYTPDELDSLRQVSSQVTVVVENFLLHSELKKLKDQSGEEKIFLKDEPSSEPSFEDIVGRSLALQRVLREVDVVAPTDSGVLIQGETGTGKELVAQAIHNRSPRRDRPFVKVNCAAIPSGLLESELFGHEKGAFTGAIMRKPGRFEVADKGTLFLDEVGDIPLDLQSKLLRVLQEREFERLGSSRTQQVDVRVIAATHRDLRKMVEEGTFRSDLYYRLHVFPLVVPPLRDRRDDIPRIVHHYVDKYAKRMNRRIETIPARTMEVFTNYSWPGNVRELQNFIERAVILSPGGCLRAPLEELKQETVQASGANNLSTLEEMEREHVLRALRESNWVTGGPNGAAVRLGMKRTTLAYRIRKLKIPCRPQ
jgi:formate hydrogenlyase transcriptional activator